MPAGIFESLQSMVWKMLDVILFVILQAWEYASNIIFRQ